MLTQAASAMVKYWRAASATIVAIIQMKTARIVTEGGTGVLFQTAAFSAAFRINQSSFTFASPLPRQVRGDGILDRRTIHLFPRRNPFDFPWIGGGPPGFYGWRLAGLGPAGPRSFPAPPPGGASPRFCCVAA